MSLLWYHKNSKILMPGESTVSVLKLNRSGPGCSKLRTSLVNVSLKFQRLISQIRQYFLLKKWEKLFVYFIPFP